MSSDGEANTKGKSKRLKQAHGLYPCNAEVAALKLPLGASTFRPDALPCHTPLDDDVVDAFRDAVGDQWSEESVSGKCINDAWKGYADCETFEKLHGGKRNSTFAPSLAALASVSAHPKKFLELGGFEGPFNEKGDSKERVYAWNLIYNQRILCDDPSNIVDDFNSDMSNNHVFPQGFKCALMLKSKANTFLEYVYVARSKRYPDRLGLFAGRAFTNGNILGFFVGTRVYTSGYPGTRMVPEEQLALTDCPYLVSRYDEHLVTIVVDPLGRTDDIKPDTLYTGMQYINDPRWLESRISTPVKVRPHYLSSFMLFAILLILLIIDAVKKSHNVKKRRIGKSGQGFISHTCAPPTVNAVKDVYGKVIAVASIAKDDEIFAEWMACQP